MRFIQIRPAILSIILTVASAIALPTISWAKTPRNPPVLNPKLTQTLDSAAQLIVEAKEANTETPEGLTARNNAYRKLEALGQLIPDDKTGASASKYLSRKIKQIEKAQKIQMKTAEKQKASAISHVKSTGHFSQYTPWLRLIGTESNNHLTDLTSDGRLITVHDEDSDPDTFTTNEFGEFIDKSTHLISIRDVTHRNVQEFRTANSYGSLSTTQYVAAKNQIYFTTRRGVFAVDLADADNTKSVLAVKPILPRTAENEKKLKMALSRARQHTNISHDNLFQALKTSNDGAIIATTYGSNILAYDSSKKSFTAMRIPKDRKKANLEDVEWSLSPNGKFIAMGSMGAPDNHLSLFDAATGNLIDSLPFVTRTVAFSNDSKWIVANDKLAQVVMQELDGKRRLRVLEYGAASEDSQRASFVEKFYFSPSDEKLFILSEDTLDVWDPSTGQFLYKQADRNNISKVAFANGHNVLATISNDEPVKLWRLIK